MLDIVTCVFLFQKDKTANEAQLTREKQEIVRNTNLASVAKQQFDLHNCITEFV